MTKLTKAQREARLCYYWASVRRQPDEPRAAHWLAALRTLHFREELRASVKTYAKRQKAARKGWKARRKAA